MRSPELNVHLQTRDGRPSALDSSAYAGFLVHLPGQLPVWLSQRCDEPSTQGHLGKLEPGPGGSSCMRQHDGCWRHDRGPGMRPHIRPPRPQGCPGGHIRSHSHWDANVCMGGRCLGAGHRALPLRDWRGGSKHSGPCTGGGAESACEPGFGLGPHPRCHGGRDPGILHNCRGVAAGEVLSPSSL